MSDIDPIAPDVSLTRGRLLARNAAMNLGGAVVPALVALVAVPVLIGGLGDARFGVLALAWTALGYFSLFDLGIGRAVTHAVADRLGEGRHDEIGAVIRTAITALLPVGIAAGAALFALAPWISRMLSLPPGLHMEATAAFRILAVAVPFASVTGALRGALEARQFFGVVNALRIPLGLLTFLAPLVTLPFSRSLVPAIATLTVGRVLLCLAHIIAVARTIPEFRAERRAWDPAIGVRLLTVGGWMQVSHMVSPLMATLDRFVVGAVLGAGLVTYYVAPQELVTKMWLFPIAVLPVFFSAISATSRRDAGRTTLLFDKLLRATLALLFLPTLAFVVLAPDILRVWLGRAFADQSAAVMQLIAIAVFVNCLGQAALSLVQGLGRADLSAKYHLAELPLYALILWFLLPRFGIVGAAVAWSVRTIGDTIVLLATCPRLLPQTGAVVRRMASWVAVTSALLALAALSIGSPARFVIIAVAVPAWVAVCWRFLLTAEERAYPMRALSGVLRPERA